MSTLALFNDLTSDRYLDVAFQPARCVRRRLRKSECTECLNVCHAEALSLVDNQVCHASSKCTGCMICTACCPNDAFEVKGYNLETSIESLTPGKDLIISCPRETQIHFDELVVPCVGGLSIIHLLLICMKRSEKIVFNISTCKSCENKTAAVHFERQLISLKKNHHNLIRAELIILKTTTEIMPAQDAEKRRSFLRGMKNSLVTAVASQLPTFQQNRGEYENKNRRVPYKVRLTRDLLKQVDQKKKDIVASLYLYDVQVTDACTICPLCKGICPTGAIKIEKVDEEKKLVIDNTLCSGCGLCVTFCKNDALRLQRPEGLYMKNEAGNG